MTDCQLKLRNRAMLRNLTYLVPVVYNQTRWSGKLLMLQRFIRSHDSLKEVAEDEVSTVSMNIAQVFEQKVVRCTVQLEQISQIIRYSKTENLSLPNCRTTLCAGCSKKSPLFKMLIFNGYS